MVDAGCSCDLTDSEGEVDVEGKMEKKLVARGNKMMVRRWSEREEELTLVGVG